MKKYSILCPSLKKNYDNYDLIIDICDLLALLNDNNLCEKFKNDFKLNNILLHKITKIVLSKDGTNYLYNYLTEIINNKLLITLKKKKILDIPSYNKIINELYPFLEKKYKKQNKIK